MTTLNTIIEEEKARLVERFKNNVYLTVPTDMDVKIADVQDFLTTAMQRAYEAGVEAQIEQFTKGMSLFMEGLLTGVPDSERAELYKRLQALTPDNK